MADFYRELAETAEQLITTYGRILRLVRLQSSAADAAMPWRGNTTPRAPANETLTIVGLAVDPKNANSLGLALKDNDFIRRAELIYVVPFVDHEDFKTFHEVIDGDRRYRIEGVEELRPGEETLLYYLAVKK